MAYKPGTMLKVLPLPNFHHLGGHRPFYTTKVLVASQMSPSYICEGETPLTHMAKWVQQECQAAGIDPGQKVRIVSRYQRIEVAGPMFDLPK